MKIQYSILLHTKEKDREYNINCWRNLKPYLEKIKQFDPDQYRYWHDMISYDMNESSFERFEYWEDPHSEQVIRHQIEDSFRRRI